MIDYKSEAVTANSELLQALDCILILERFIQDVSPPKALLEVESIVGTRTEKTKDWKDRAQARIKKLKEE